ncbi:conserved hypothetical protein [Leishmania mexicana MHOM/GT/2001/U1103]|uniref:SET domain-containing protein n=1 Tax=Leishmania mexicana (strain MHOM/GT/2001/U1103) TaxID=929439 RepID=E9AK80_LEIMU|nr:conserved hypothetical protein [Leishmania mexicana MHOM/GT/2001/U1103]CBZ23330.1 conserved hypothetical protein [Leishmania mexicana MHOM/GT/2001/U1103]
MPWDANGLANDDGDELCTVLEDARTVQAGHLGRSRPTAEPSLSRFPVASSPHGGGHDHLRSRGDADVDLCETRQTQELRDDFFALYTSQADAASPNDRSGRGGVTPSVANASATAAGSHGDDDAASPSDQEDEGAGRDHDVDVLGEVRVGRADDHHAQQSQYVPECSEDLEEEDGIADSSESPVVSEQPAEGFRSEAQPPPSRSDTTPATERPCQPECWPHPHPPPFSALPRLRQTRVTFHTQRYGAFIKAYLGLSDAEVEQAQRRGRGICMIGVRKAPPSSWHLAASASYSTPFSPPSSSSPAAGAAGYTFQPMHRRHLHHGFVEPVKVQRSFLRHSVLAVEGDAVFSELMDRAELLYAVEQHRLDAAWKTYAHDTGAAGEDAAAAAATAVPGTPAQPPLYPQFRKLPRVTEPYLRPNARCIALHYGLPDRAASDSSDGSAGKMATDTAAVKPREGEGEEGKPHTHRTSSTSAPANPYPRASLMAVVCTTRLEEGEEIYVSLESYYRCLDEVSWYRRCYSELNKRCGCPDGVVTPCAAAEGGSGMNEPTAGQEDLTGNVYTGVKPFPEWPADLAYYHGVGRRHASYVAEAAFPFTLVSLAPAPELGDNQKGVVASAWLPYGTCLLYCGPAVATRKVERLVSERALRGDNTVDRTTTTVKHEAQAHSAAEEDDLSFATDDTYALGLGPHGVCFGQGLTRYINHRYNTSRFGNVELCSVILSVPSEFASAHGTAAAPADGPEELKNPGERVTAKSAGVDASSSLTAEERVQVARAATAKRPYHRRRVQRAKKGPPPPVVAASGAVAAPAAAVDDRLAAMYAKPKRRPPRRRAPCLFLEERSFFVTVPFFLVTTDIPPGTSLLAWTYGEDYDAKLERQAVAEGHVVPYADAVLLNRRLAASPATGCRFQRYNGDYRFAVGVGDVVWRRRPVRLGMPSSSVDCAGGHAIVDVYVPPPEEDLFVVVQTLRSSVERVLLRPLERVPLTSRQLGTLLREQHLDDYVSPHAPSNARLGPQKGRRRVGRPPSAHSKRQRAAVLTYDWAAHWAVFRLTDISALAPAPFAGTSSCLTPHALSRYEEALRTCVVATTDSVGLLLMDIDYSAVHRTGDTGGEAGNTGAPRRITGSLQGPTTRASSGSGGGPNAKQCTGRGGESAAHRHILVNLDDLHHATALVRTSPGRAAAVPTLCSGLMWPLYCMSQKPRAAAAAAFGASHDVPRARPGSRM